MHWREMLSQLVRTLMTARLTLGIPAMGLTRQRPAELADLVLAAIGHESVDGSSSTKRGCANPVSQVAVRAYSGT